MSLLPWLKVKLWWSNDVIVCEYYTIYWSVSVVQASLIVSSSFRASGIVVDNNRLGQPNQNFEPMCACVSLSRYKIIFYNLFFVHLHHWLLIFSHVSFNFSLFLRQHLNLVFAIHQSLLFTKKCLLLWQLRQRVPYHRYDQNNKWHTHHHHHIHHQLLHVTSGKIKIVHITSPPILQLNTQRFLVPKFLISNDHNNQNVILMRLQFLYLQQPQRQNH